LALNWAANANGGNDMKMEFVLMRGKDDGYPQVEVDTFEIVNAVHIPRIDETIYYRGRDYRVSEVTWDFEEDRVFVGGRF